MTKQILLIDDEDLVIRSVKKLFEKAGFEVIVARSGEEGIQKALEYRIDVIVCDVRMPGKGGRETISEIAAQKEARGKSMPPFIFLTGYADDDLEGAAQGPRPSGVVYKPFDAGQLLELVGAIF